MSIIGMFKKLISGTSVEPAKQSQVNGTQLKPKIISTIEKSRSNTIDNWKDNQDVINGLRFIATLQLRTPLRVLLRHGEIHTDVNTKPPEIAMEMWEGIWTVKTKTLRELGVDIDEKPPGMHASDIGPVLPADYLPFLIAIRKVVELDEPIDNRIEKLREMLIKDEWKIHVDKHGGIVKIIRYFFSEYIDTVPSTIQEIIKLNVPIDERMNKIREMPIIGDWEKFLNNHDGLENVINGFFPKFINTIPALNLFVKEELFKLGLNTPSRITSASDDTILSIKGIGKAKLKIIRNYCASVVNNRDSDRIDNVLR